MKTQIKKKKQLPKYIGIFSGLFFLRSAVQQIMADAEMLKSDIIYVERVPKGDERATHSFTFKKKVRKGRKKTSMVEKQMDFIFEATGYNGDELSIDPMPVRMWDENGEAWVIPQAAREEPKQ
jgi:hypothetical protein